MVGQIPLGVKNDDTQIYEHDTRNNKNDVIRNFQRVKFQNSLYIQFRDRMKNDEL